MILSRVIAHVKEQNWFAVALDFVIVVAGVFVGLQAQEWSARRAMSARTTQLMQRLEADFGVDVWVARGLYDYHKQVARNARMTFDDITGRVALSDEQLLIAAHRASQFNRFNPTSGIYEELVATGGLELITSTKIGSVAAVFYKTSIINDYETDGKNSEYRRLYRSLLPIDVQLAVADQCGDRRRTIDEIMSEKSVVGYPCKLDLPADRMAEAADLLRRDAALAPALRHRIATLATQNRDFKTIVDAIEPYKADRETMLKSGLTYVFGEH